jgi:hypothetical protein
MGDNYKRSSNGQYKNYVINPSGPKPEIKRTESEKKALIERRERMAKLDDMEFAKRLGIFTDLY